jgi:hypothetical protein
MDVYIETENDIYYIESKYCEVASNENLTKEGKLSHSYWDDRDRKLLYYHFWGQEDIAKSFSIFVKEAPSGIDKNDWFDAKQECTHLFGILLDNLTEENGDKRKNPPSKRIRFYNVVFNCGGETESDFAKKFIQAANDSFGPYFNKKFTYSYCWYQDLYNALPETVKAFELKDTSLKDLLAERYPGINEPLTREKGNDDSLINLLRALK